MDVFVFMYVFAICYVCFLQLCDHLLGKALPFGSIFRDVFFSLCHFPIQCPEPGVQACSKLNHYFSMALLQLLVHILRSFSLFLTNKIRYA